MANQKERNLALAIASCSDVCSAIKDANHPCHKVVSWQADQFEPRITEVIGSRLHRPEPWTGDLATAKIMFLSSNPSFNPAENFPNWNEEEWNDEDVSIFGAERFTSNIERKFGAIDSPDSLLRDRTIERSRVLSDLVKHWAWVRRYAAFVLDKSVPDTSAISDYVMTELVHCKSRQERGVQQALSHCSEKWFEKMMAISPASLIFVAGKPAAESFVEMFHDQVPSEWGPWQKSKSDKSIGVFPKSIKHLQTLLNDREWGIEEQKKNMCLVELSGKPRLVVYLARPGGHGLPSPWVHSELVHPEILKLWRSKIL